MRPIRIFHSPEEAPEALPLPGLRPGVVLVGEGEEAELRDLRLGQVVKLGNVAAVIVGLLDGTRDAERLLIDAQIALGEELNPLGLVELLQALDRRALLDTPRARMVVAQGLVRADIAALQRLAKRVKPLRSHLSADAMDDTSPPQMAPESRFTCASCNRCCSEQHLLGPVTRQERDAILKGFNDAADRAGGADPSNFIPLPTGDGRELYVLRTREGFCVYLGRDGLCNVHRDLGVELKPAVCRMFPYRVTRTPDGWDAGLSLTCPTVAGGRGGDPKEEAQDKIDALPIFESLIHEAPPSVVLGEGVHAAWGDYRAWERKAIAMLQNDDRDPADAWVDAIVELGRTITKVIGEETAEQETAEFAPISEETQEAPDESFVPIAGLGDCPLAPQEAADVFARDMALWSELLVGLEAADPNALRHLRSGSTRVRADVGPGAEAAPVLAELARIKSREQEEQRMGGEVTARVDTVAPDWAVQRRFLVQALMDKRLFEYGTIARGTTLLSLLLAVLRLPEIQGDEMRALITDAAYLVHHPQLADIVDSRAVVRACGEDPVFHASLLGVRLRPDA